MGEPLWLLWLWWLNVLNVGRIIRIIYFERWLDLQLGRGLAPRGCDAPSALCLFSTCHGEP